MSPKEWVLKRKGDRPNRAWIWNENYGHGCYILWPVTSKQLKEEYLNAHSSCEHRDDETFAINGGKFIDYDDRCCIAFSSNRPTVGMIAHECLHLSHSLFRAVGVPLDYENDEAQAYFVQWAVNKIYDLTRGRK